LQERELGAAIEAALDAHGLGAEAGPDEIESALYAPEARALALTPSPPMLRAIGRHRAPRYRWSREVRPGPEARRAG
jgi:hypothetical protein